MKQRNCALILGGYVNGYSIIQELYEKGVRDIILFDSAERVCLASHSNKIREFVAIDKTAASLHKALKTLHHQYEKIVIFPTDDLHLEQLHQLHGAIEQFCFLPFNHGNLLQTIDKYVQYSFCEKLGVPHPKTVVIRDLHNIEDMLSLPFPMIVKPTKKEYSSTNIFRTLQLANRSEFERNIADIGKYVSQGIAFMVSEIIPGSGSNIYAYVGYRNKEGNILNEWTGKKLSQYPNEFGSFSSASNQAPVEVLHQGRALLDGMNLCGIVEPEFKYDHRDGKYKLTEINLRSMMWHRVGNLSGVNIQYSQYLDAIGQDVEKQTQIKDRDIHFVYLKYEILNLLARRGYLRVFVSNIFRSDETHFAVYDRRDIRPFLIDCIGTLVGMVLILPKSTAHIAKGVLLAPLRMLQRKSRHGDEQFR